MFVLIAITMLIPLSTCLLDEDYVFLPNKYDIHDYDDCVNNNKQFCNMKLILTPLNETHPSRTWEIIKTTKQEYRYVKHDELYYGWCFERSEPQTFYDIAKQNLTARFTEMGIRGEIYEFKCLDKDQQYQWLDFGLVSTLPLHIIFVALVTWYIYKFKNGDNVMKNRIIVYASVFSFVNAWKQLVTPINNIDFNYLKSIQGIRVFNMMLIIFTHTFTANLVVYCQNPSYFEDLYLNVLKHLTINMMSFLVETYFLISAWLLAVQVTNLYHKNGKLTFRDVCILSLNRYLRLVPVIAAMMIFVSSYTIKEAVHDIYKDTINNEIGHCRTGWWINLLFLQNYYVPGTMCYAGSWYVAADTQMYMLSILLFYISFKLRIKPFYLMTIAGGIAAMIQSINVLNSDFDGLFRIKPKLATLHKPFAQDEFVFSYVMTHCHIITYMIGLTLGIIYHKYRGTTIFYSKVSKVLWLTAFFGLPVLALLLSLGEYTRSIETVIAVTLKPLYALGIGIGILGMATKTGGIIKSVCEWPPLIFLANFTYSVYIFHFAFVFTNSFGYGKMVLLSDFSLALSLLRDILGSFAIGGLMHLLIELPFIQLQKLIVPQFPRFKEKDSKNGVKKAQ